MFKAESTENIANEIQVCVECDLWKVRAHAPSENTYVGKSSHLSNCVVAEDCRIGSQVMVEETSLIGSECEIGDGAQILARALQGLAENHNGTQLGNQRHSKRMNRTEESNLFLSSQS